MHRRLIACIALTMLAPCIAIAAVSVVSQKGRAFAFSKIQIVHGDVVRFVNEDTFLHQIFVDAPAFQYESAEQEPGTNVEIQFPKAGTFNVRCEIHPKMLLVVEVR